MKSSSFFMFIAIVSFLSVCAQSQQSGLYMPLEFQKAYKKETRKLDGSVSSLYWQDRSVYQLKAKIDPYKKLLQGEGRIVYYNNSPDTVKQIVFQTYPDYYKAGATRAGFFSATYDSSLISDGMVIEKLIIGDSVIDITNTKLVDYGGTNVAVTLSKPLSPKSSVKIEANWHYTIPGKGFERSGIIDSTAMFIGYWYPEIAVRDDIDGWDRIIYDASTEFYHNYSDYEVEVDVPDNFIVWASVAPDNGDEVYPDFMQQRILNAKKSNVPVVIMGQEDYKNGLKMKSHHWRYTAPNFPDFSFALSDHFIWEAREYKDEKGDYFINTAYDSLHKAFKTVLEAEGLSLNKFHHDFPSYSFPFKYFTIFNGLIGGGMEFAGMANNYALTGEELEGFIGKKTSDLTASVGISIHEMCHMYFPFLMGIHEKKYAWMDEGMAQFTSYFVGDTMYIEFDQPYLARQTVSPMMVPTYTQQLYSPNNSYTVAAMSYYSLYHLLGKDLFIKCLNGYMDEWNHKHPTPYDFMFSFNRLSQRNLNWFWKRWYFDWAYIDIGIKDFKNNMLTIENLGGRPVAFSIVYHFSDGTQASEDVSPAVWESSSIYTQKINPAKTIDSIQLKIFTNGDAVKENNWWKLKQ